MASKSMGIVVLGMHRAGTSATGHILVDLGFEMPGESVPADPDNPKGYWEPREIVEIHDAFLHGIGRCWSDPRPFEPGVFDSEAADTARTMLREVVQQTLLPRKRWVIKDPRMCRLMPLWEGLLDEPGLSHRFLHVLRSPLSVADSLYQRDKFSPEKSFMLWLRHNLEAEAATRDQQRSWLSFEEVSGASASQVNERFRSATGWSRLSDKRIQKAITDVLDHSLVHSDHGLEESLEQLAEYPWIATAYQALTSLSLNGGKQGQAELDELRPQIVKADALKLGDPEFWGTQLVNERLHWLRESIENQRREIKAQRAEVDALRSTFNGERQGLVNIQQEVGIKYSDLIDRLRVSEEMLQGMGEALGTVGGSASVLKTLRDELQDWARHQTSVADQRQEGVEMLRSSIEAWVRDQVGSQAQHRKLLDNLHETLEKWARRQAETSDLRRLATDSLLEKLNASLGALGARIHQLENQASTLDKAVTKHAVVGDQSQILVRESLNALGSQTQQLKVLEGTVGDVSRQQAKAIDEHAKVVTSLAQLGDHGHWLGELKELVREVTTKQEAASGDQGQLVKAQETIAETQQRLLDGQQTVGQGQKALVETQQATVEALVAVRTKLEAGDDSQRRRVRVLQETLNDQSKTFASISGSVREIERLIVERLENRHLALLSKSLGVSAELETRWQGAQDKVSSMVEERDQRRIELDIALRERDAAIQARDAASQGRDAALRERRTVIEGRDVALVEQSHVFARELDKLREEVVQVASERDRARAEIDQLLGRFSWKLTAPLRAVVKGLKSLRP